LILDVKLLCSVDYQISASKLRTESSYKSPLTNEKWRNFSFAIEILLKNATLEFRVRYKGNLTGVIEAEYKETFLRDEFGAAM